MASERANERMNAPGAQGRPGQAGRRRRALVYASVHVAVTQPHDCATLRTSSIALDKIMNKFVITNISYTVAQKWHNVCLSVSLITPLVSGVAGCPA